MKTSIWGGSRRIVVAKIWRAGDPVWRVGDCVSTGISGEIGIVVERLARKAERTDDGHMCVRDFYAVEC